MDAIIHAKHRRIKDGVRPYDSIGCYLVTKYSWRGKYKRLLCITKSSLITNLPESFFISNQYQLQGTDAEINKVSVGKSEEEFIISARGKNERRFTEIKFSCSQRSSLLSDLYKILAELQPQIINLSPNAPIFNAVKLKRRGELRWQPCRLRVGLTAIERLHATTDEVQWVLEFKNINSPGVMLLPSGDNDPPSVFALFGKIGRSPRVYAMPGRDSFLAQVQTAALGRFGVNVTAENGQSNGLELLNAVVAAQQEQSAMANEAPLSSWMVRRIVSDSKIRDRRLVVCQAAVLERRISSEEVCERRPLQAIEVIVRCVKDGRRFELHWTDGYEASIYEALNRDEVVCALLDAAQNHNGRSVPLLMKSDERADKLLGSNEKDVQQVCGNLLVAALKEYALSRSYQPGQQQGLSPRKSLPLDYEDGERNDSGSDNSGSNPTPQFPQGGAGTLPASLGKSIAAAMQNVKNQAQIQMQNQTPQLEEQEALEIVFERLKFINANVPYSGGLEVQQGGLLRQLIEHSWVLGDLLGQELSPDQLFQVLQCAGRLAFVPNFIMQGLLAQPKTAAKLLSLLRSPDDGIQCEVVRLLTRFFAPSQFQAGLGSWAFVKQEESSEASESIRKIKALFFSNGIDPLWGPDNERHKDSIVLSMFMVELLCALIVPPQSKSTPPDILQSIQKATAAKPAALFALFQHPASRARKGAAMLARAVTSGMGTVQQSLRSSAMQGAAVLRHLRLALYDDDDSGQKGLSRELISMWCDRSFVPSQQLMKQIFPFGLLSVLQQKGWSALWTAFDGQHRHAGLIWNNQTRSELKQYLDQQDEAFRGAQSADPYVHWNWQEFVVEYPSLKGELFIGGVYLALLLEGGDAAVMQLGDPRELFSQCFYKFLCSDDIDVQVLCKRVMAKVYRLHPDKVGPFWSIEQCLYILDNTTSVALRVAEVEILLALLEGDDGKEAKLVNGRQVIQAGGIQLFLELTLTAHWRVSRGTTQGSQVKMITAYTHEQQQQKEWFYMEGDKQKGPVSKEELKSLYHKGTLTMKSRVKSKQETAFSQLKDIRQLRWWLSGVGKVREPCLRLLHILVELFTPESGEVVYPPPRAYAQLCSEKNLHHISQIMLTNEPELVGAAASLLTKLSTVIPDALHRLYSTGAFFFALLYSGSDWLEIAKLFKVSHLEQHSVDNSDEHRTGLLSRRSYLGPLLPESLLYQLERYGADVFAAKFVQDCDDPELLWTNEMRFDRLVQQLKNHIGEFPLRLSDNILLIYEYTPPPPIGYPQLDEEIWCHGYYLRSLCQVDKFPDYPIKEPVPFLQSLLTEWRKELTKQPMSMSEIEARKILGMPEKVDENNQTKDSMDEELRKAYRRMARLYHPDKNPEGKKQFMEIQKAYELLQHRNRGGSAGGGTELWRIKLLLSAQCIVFRRCKKELEPFKYAGYPMLLEALTVPETSALFGTQNAKDEMSGKVLLAAAELCWLTCACSPRNGEELTRCGGVKIVGKLLRRCISMVPSSKPATLSVMYLIGSLAALAMFQVGREQLAQDSAVGVVQDVLQMCTLGDSASGCASAALTCVSQMCGDERLQTLLVSSNAIQKLLPLLFEYDATQVNFNPILEDTELVAKQGVIATGLDASEQESVQMNKNFRAQLALVCLCRLAGLLGGELESPSHQLAKDYLEGAMTGPLMSRLLQLDAHKELLKVLNEGIETPESVWSLSMRLQLLKFLEDNEDGDLRQLQYKDVCQEIVKANVYVRLYTEQKDWPLTDPGKFCKELIIYLHEVIAKPQSSGPEAIAAIFNSNMQLEQHVLQRKHVLYVVRAIFQVLLQYPNKISLLATWSAITPLVMSIRPTILAGHNQQLKDSFVDIIYQDFQNSKQDSQPPVSNTSDQGIAAAEEDTNKYISYICQLSFKVMIKLLESAKCAATLGREEVYQTCIWVAHRSWTHTEVQQALTLLHGISNTRDAAWFASGKGGCVYLLNVLIPLRNRDKETKTIYENMIPIRQSAGRILSVMLKDQLHGERLKQVLLRLLPEGLVELLVRTQTERLIQVLDVEKELETPEIIWNNRMYDLSAREIDTLTQQARFKQSVQIKNGQAADWSVPENFSIQHEILQHQLYLGGVYVQLYLKMPEFALQDPPRFLQSLLQELEKRLGSENHTQERETDVILSLCAASAQLLRYQRTLAAVCIRLGVVDFVLKHLSKRVEKGQDEISGGLLRLLHQLMYYKELSEVIPSSKYKPVILLQKIIGWGLAPAIIALETLKRILEHRIDKVQMYIGEQTLGIGLLDELLLILQQGSSGIAQQSEENARRVLAIDVINLLSEGESQCSEEVQALLNESEIWQSYKGRKHDLFLPHGTSQAGGVIAALGSGTLKTYALPSPQQQQTTQ